MKIFTVAQLRELPVGTMFSKIQPAESDLALLVKTSDAGQELRARSLNPYKIEEAICREMAPTTWPVVSEHRRHVALESHDFALYYEDTDLTVCYDAHDVQMMRDTLEVVAHFGWKS